MRPCAVCGSTTINATGHCAHCGTFRGVPHPGYPQPGIGGPGYPNGAPPVAYPTSGGGYPGGFVPPAAPPVRRSLLILLVALGSTLAVLVVAIILVISLRKDDGVDPVADPTTSTPATPQNPENPEIDSCVIGTWRITSHREEVNNEELGKLTFTGGEGGKLRLMADGTGEADYGNGTKYTADAGNQEIRLEILGLVNFRYTAVDGELSTTDIDSHATFKLFIDDEQYGETQPFDASEAPSSYTCLGDSLTQETLLFTTEYERID